MGAQVCKTWEIEASKDCHFSTWLARLDYILVVKYVECFGDDDIFNGKDGNGKVDREIGRENIGIDIQAPNNMSAAKQAYEKQLCK